MFGPFQPEDLGAKYFREISVGDFLITPEGIFLAVNWSTTAPKPDKDRLVQFDPRGLPREAAIWRSDRVCLAIKPKGRFDVSVADSGCNPDEGCIGISTAGALAIIIAGGSSVQLGTWELRTSLPLGGSSGPNPGGLSSS